MLNSDYYFHHPGTPSLGAVLDVGLRCLHSCKFCYYSFFDSERRQFQALRRGTFRSLGDCLDILSAIAAYGLKHVDVTGGEPTLHPDIVKITDHAAKIGLGMRIITLGQFLLQKHSGGATLLKQLLEAGIADFLFSVHGVDKDSFREFTGGSWKKLSSAMRILQNTGFQFGTNTVVFRDNLSLLPEIARKITEHGAYIHNFIIFNAYHRWAKISELIRMQPRFRDIYPPIQEAVDILDKAGVAVNIRYAPLCVFPGLERHIVGIAGVHFDPYEWRNRACNYDRDPAYCAKPIPPGADGLFSPHALQFRNTATKRGLAVFAVRGQNLKIFSEPCKNCAALTVCDGIDPNYADQHGLAEFVPFAGLEANGALIKARLGYRPPFFVKMGAMADMKSVISSYLT